MKKKRLSSVEKLVPGRTTKQIYSSQWKQKKAWAQQWTPRHGLWTAWHSRTQAAEGKDAIEKKVYRIWVLYNTV
jgi:hypothetical protein